MYKVEKIKSESQCEYYWVVFEKDGYKHRVCRIENHYLNNQGIAEGIAKLLNGKQILVDLSV